MARSDLVESVPVTLTGFRPGVDQWEIHTLLVSEGQEVAEGDLLFEVMPLPGSVAPGTPQGFAMVPAPASGVLAAVMVAEGDRVAPGDELAVITRSGAAGEPTGPHIRDVTSLQVPSDELGGTMVWLKRDGDYVKVGDTLGGVRLQGGRSLRILAPEEGSLQVSVRTGQQAEPGAALATITPDPSRSGEWRPPPAIFDLALPHIPRQQSSTGAADDDGASVNTGQVAGLADRAAPGPEVDRGSEPPASDVGSSDRRRSPSRERPATEPPASDVGSFGRRGSPSTERPATEPPSLAPTSTGSTASTRKPSTPSGKVKVSFNLWPEDVDRLRGLAAAARTTVTAALQRAIADDVFFDEEMGKGARVLLRYPDGEYREVIMRR